MAYTGLSDAVRHAVDDRDGHRCRWCGATNRGRDIHHIEYRRGESYDVPENLICLCRSCHNFVHGTRRPSGLRIVKEVAQRVLLEVIATPGSTGASLWRQLKHRFEQEGLCEHGSQPGMCRWC